ncbi:biotin transporter BioY [Olsenella profusa]|uniref:Biotin transporter n=1 Tax=Olsenella profusa TaxID=138595 RepID=A0ABS2F1H4_9ACTN|nr:biotin transporter BioY [Olsenella profusa]MBM6774443.1 biotin transporter BioY [Olsenella profusa]
MSPRQTARCGLCVALLAVGSSISVPLGPVPFTLQTLVLAMLPVALGGRDATVTVAVWIVAGAVGLPVFSGLSGGIGHILGPTGGYIWGFLVGMVLAAAVLRLGALPRPLREAFAVTAMLLVSYALGTLQLMALMGVDLAAALGMAVVPFVIPDVFKLAAGVAAGRAVRRALPLDVQAA